MFCHKCGTQMDEASNFCPSCGTQRPDTATPPAPVENTYVQPVIAADYTTPEQSATLTESDQPPVKSRKLWKVLLPVCAVLVAAVGIGIYFLTIAAGSASVGAALAGLRNEMSARLAASPLHALAILPDVIENGQFVTDIYYTDSWGDELSGIVAIQTDTKNREFAILADASIYGMDVDLNAYINKNRVALQSSLLDGNSYGFEYATFRQDITGFGELIGLDDYTMDMLADAVEVIGDVMNQKPAETLNNKAYTKVLTDFFMGLDSKSSKTELPYGDSTEKYKKVDYTVTKEALLKLFNDYYAVLANDKSLREQFDNLLSMYEQYGINLYYEYGITDYDDFLYSLVKMIDTFEREYEGVVTLSFYLDGDWLVCLTAQLDAEIDGEKGVIDIVCDFGAVNKDSWVITMTATDDSGYRNTVKITWSYSEVNSRSNNKIEFVMDDGYYKEEFSLTSIWEKSSGAFTLSYDDGYDTGELTGNYRETDGGFALAFDIAIDEYYNEHLWLEIKAEKGVTIDDPPYINLDKWNEDLLYKLSNMMFSLY